jgi:GNAT superfamily N-acetyltransferase
MLSATDRPVDVTVDRAALAGFPTHAVTSRRNEPDPARQAGRYVLCMRHTAGSFELDDDPGRVDRDAVWTFLSQEAYWGRWRSRADLEHQLDSAWRVVGGYETGSGRMAGFARAVSDGVAYAYLADVFVVAGARGRGLGTALVETMIDHGLGAGFRWCLHTSDAHGLYQKFGFTHPDQSYLERPPGGWPPAGPSQHMVNP